MVRTTGIAQNNKRQVQVAQEFGDVRKWMSSLFGRQYKGVRNVYEALGYPTEEQLDFEYYFGKYSRQDIASAVIDRPADKTWTGTIELLEKDTIPVDSKLTKEWDDLDEAFKLKPLLKKLDKLACLGHFALLLYGFSDTKDSKDFIKPVSKRSKLLYLKTVAENAIKVLKWEENTSNPRYGKPLIYQIIITQPGTTQPSSELEVHYSRVLHVNTESLTSEIYGRPALHPIVNRLEDIEKLLGGDAEMFWRGARPGYTALSQPDYALSDPELDKLNEELDKYEHDMRRFITAQGIDIKALEQQVADPLNHLDAQIQAISAQTGIPKRILIGSERGELSSAQDTNAWLELIQTRQTEHNEPIILRPFVDKCMELGILTQVEYNVIWRDVFAPSESDKVKIGKTRAEALKIYSDSIDSREILDPKLAGKYLLGLDPVQILEIEKSRGELALEEDEEMTGSEEVVLTEAV